MTPPRSKKTALILICFSRWSSSFLVIFSPLVSVSRLWPQQVSRLVFSLWQSSVQVWIQLQRPGQIQAQEEALPAAGVPSFQFRIVSAHPANWASPSPTFDVGFEWHACNAGSGHRSVSNSVNRLPAGHPAFGRG